MKKFGALSSSVNPQELATSVTGVMQAVGGLLAFMGFNDIAGHLPQITQEIGQVITLGYAFYGACNALFGLIRKLIVSIQQAWAKYRNPVQ